MLRGVYRLKYNADFFELQGSDLDNFSRLYYVGMYVDIHLPS